jgi:hypothetical protein
MKVTARFSKGGPHMKLSTVSTIGGMSLLALAGIAQAVTLAPARGTNRPTVIAAPTQSSAPLVGMVTAIDITKGEIAINTQRYAIGSGQVLMLDKRPQADGLLALKDITPGMVVKYRAEPAEGVTRVVELWVLKNPDKGIRK